MTTDTESIAIRLSELRKAFDEALTAPLTNDFDDEERYLVCEVDGRAIAFKIEDLQGVEAKKKIVPVPGARQLLLGVAGVYGDLIPIFSPSAGRTFDELESERSWIVLCRNNGRIGLAVDKVKGFARVRATERFSLPQSERAHPHMHEVAILDGEKVLIFDSNHFFKGVVEGVLINKRTT